MVLQILFFITADTLSAWNRVFEFDKDSNILIDLVISFLHWEINIEKNITRNLFSGVTLTVGFGF